MRVKWNYDEDVYDINFTPAELGALIVALETAAYRTQDKDLALMFVQLRKETHDHQDSVLPV